MTSTPREWRFGSTHIWFEPPDILWHKSRGVTPLAECMAYMEVYRELGSKEPFFSVVDMTEAGTLEEECRRYVSEAAQTEWFKGIIYIRARLLHKAIATSIGVFHRLIGRPTLDAHFVATEEEARAIIARIRGGL
jgi:hypothetical protein